jgi:hypothetical protein
MGFKERMAKKRKNMRKRAKTQKKRERGGRFPTVFNKANIPEGVEFWFCKEGRHTVDVIPWEAGPDMPLDGNGNPMVEEGELAHILELFVHTNVGTMKQPYVCPYENFGLPCPICEYRNNLTERIPKDEYSKLRAKHRNVFLVWVHDDRDQMKKGLQIFEAAHYFMGEPLEEAAELPRGGGQEAYYDWDEGKNVTWRRKGSGATDTDYIGHKLIDRERDVPDKIYDSSFSVDQIVNMHPTYEEIQTAFRGTMPDQKDGDEDEDDWEEPKRRKRPSDSKRSKKRKKSKKEDSGDAPKRKKRKRRK